MGLLKHKHDTLSSIPSSVLSEDKIDELKRIPRVIVGEISTIDGLLAIYRLIKTMQVDAFVPTIAYTGVEYGTIELLYKNVHALKKIIEKDIGIYITKPVLLGSPQLWGALNGRFITELQNKFKFYIPCAGCRLYMYALRVPLCKKINVSGIVSARSQYTNKSQRFYESETVIRHCRNFLSSFGVTLYHEIIEDNERNEIVRFYKTRIKENFHYCNFCILADNYRNLEGGFKEPLYIDKYYEYFAIPTTAKILSKALAGKHIDYLSETINTLLPHHKIKAIKQNQCKGRGILKT
jgi:hypothetical protein